MKIVQKRYAYHSKDECLQNRLPGSKQKVYSRSKAGRGSEFIMAALSYISIKLFFFLLFLFVCFVFKSIFRAKI